MDKNTYYNFPQLQVASSIYFFSVSSFSAFFVWFTKCNPLFSCFHREHKQQMNYEW